MKVHNKKTFEEFDVFDITYDNNGYPHFLIYDNNQWQRISAKHFTPYVSDKDFLKKYLEEKWC